MGKKILVIEDEKNIAETLADILEVAGYEVKIASDGESGFFSAIKDRPDLILCDIMMPKMDGYEVLEAVRSYRKSREIPFIFLTAKGDTGDFREGMDLGADDYLVKPVETTTLFNAIEKRLGKYDHLIQLGNQEENKRLTRDLHDTLQQTLLALKIRLGKLEVELMDSGNSGDISVSLELVTLAISQLRLILEGNDLGWNTREAFSVKLAQLVKRLADYVPFKISLINEMKSEISPNQAEDLFKVMLEILNNAIKHSQASRLTITLSQTSDEFEISVKDDGVGFNQHTLVEGRGFRNITERVEFIRGRLEIASTPGKGTEYKIKL